jgi:hypothetical protein
MATHPTQLVLTAEQMRQLDELAARTGKSYADLFDEWLASARMTEPAEVVANSSTQKSLYDVLSERGMLGCFDGPTDLSTNPKHMEGFGRNGSGSNSH